MIVKKRKMRKALINILSKSLRQKRDLNEGKLSHPARRRRGDIVTTSLCTSQQHRSYVSNETRNDVWMERREDVSLVLLHDILLERCEDVSRGRNNEVLLVRLHDVSIKSRMKHPTASHWYVTKTSQWYVSTTSH